MCSEPDRLRPAALTGAWLAGVPGVIGDIARARAAELAVATTAPAGGHHRSGLRVGAVGGFIEAVAGRAEQGGPPAVIAEVKRASPSLGLIADLDPVLTAGAYAAGGAVAVSVLTEPHWFGGSLAHLETIARNVPLPTLRKDFVVHPQQVEEAAAVGARAVLLIARLLGDALDTYLRFAEALGLDPLVEVHDEADLQRAIGAGARLIGVNNRDLADLRIDLERARRLIARGRSWAPGVTWVAESGYRSASDIVPLAGLADAILIGSHLAGSGDPAGTLRALRRDVDVRLAESADRGA